MRCFFQSCALAVSLVGCASAAPDGGALIGPANVPLGTILAFSGAETEIPDGWLPCDGRPLPRDTFARLFAVIGTMWGSSDPSSFNIPDLRGRTMVGSGSGPGLSPRALGSTYGEENAPLLAHRHAGPNHYHLWIMPGGGANIRTGGSYNSSVRRGDDGGGMGLQDGSHNATSTGGLRTDSRGADDTSAPKDVVQQPGSNMQPSATVTFVCRVR